MFKRSQKRAATLALAPLVATIGLTSIGATASADDPGPLARNGSFEEGRAGWEARAARTKITVVNRGPHGDKALALSNRTAGSAVLDDAPNTITSGEAGDLVTVSAFVRTTQERLTGRIVVLEQTGDGTRLRNESSFPVTDGWTKVTLTSTSSTTGSLLDVRVRADRLREGKVFLVDGITVDRRKPKVTPTPTNPTPTPTNPTPTNPTPTPTNPTPTPTTPAEVGGRLTNGCTYSTRGIPACGVLMGAAYGGNADPTPWEQQMGKPLGVRRTYYGPTSVDKAVQVSAADLAKKRIPWISFKLPHSWADMAAGKGDAWALDLSTKLSKLNGPVWLAFHHEPEGDGDIAQWTAMQARLAPLVRKAAPNVAYSIVLTGWNQFYGPSQYSLDALWPKNTKIDLAGFDPYNHYGVVKDGKEQTFHTDMVGRYFKPFQAWSKTTGVPWAIAETGLTDKAALDRPTWFKDTYTQIGQYGGVAFTYFNTNLNSIAQWALTPEFKKQQYTDAIRPTPTI